MRGVAAGLALPRFRGQRWLVVSTMNAYANRVCRFLVNGCGLSLAADEHDGSEVGSGLPCSVGEVSAFVAGGLGGCEVDGVGVAASAEGDVGPLNRWMLVTARPRCGPSAHLTTLLPCPRTPERLIFRAILDISPP